MHRVRRVLGCLIAALVAGLAQTAVAFGLDYPWCMGSGGGKFLCSTKDEQVQVAREAAELGYLEFVGRAFVADTITVVRGQQADEATVSLHRGGGGIVDLTSLASEGVRSRMQETAMAWFRQFCAAKGGRTWRYPHDVDTPNATRLGCHSKDDVVGLAPMFGIQASRGVSYRATDQTPVVAMEHFGTGAAVLQAWGYPKAFKVGDTAEQGLVVALKPPLARVQQAGDGGVQELWIKVKELRPVVPVLKVGG